MADANFQDFFSQGGAGGPYGSLPVFPDAIPLSGNEVSVTFTQDPLLATTPYDGTFINRVNLPLGGVSTSPINGYLDETIVWTVIPTDLYALADGWGSSYWLDDINGYLWCIASDGTTALQFARIDLETGVMTKLGSPYVITAPAPLDLEIPGNFAISRPNVNSGDFTFHFSDRTVTVDEGTGNTTENIGVGLSIKGDSGISYITADGTAGVRSVAKSTTSSDSLLIVVANGSSVAIPVPAASIYAAIQQEVVGFSQFGTGRVALLSAAQAPVFYSQTKIDSWIKLCATYGGIL